MANPRQEPRQTASQPSGSPLRGPRDGNCDDQRDSYRGAMHSDSTRALVLALALACAACEQSREILIAFRSEQQAQEHCPNDAVVWVDPQRGAYFLKGSPAYARAGAGRYACRGEAESAGMHQTAD